MPVSSFTSGVLHVSHVSDYGDDDYVIKTCKHIVESINKAGTISRMIFTSSIAGIISEISLTELLKRPVLYEDRAYYTASIPLTHRNLISRRVSLRSRDC